MDREQREIILSIGLLASDRVDTIQKCLDSLAPLREAVPCQLIITDTGCSAGVRRLLEEYADTLTEFAWCDDFAAARNENLRHAVGKWYLYLDDDEWFSDMRDLIDFFASGKYQGYDSAFYIQRNYQTRDGSMYTDAHVFRMAVRSPELHFEGRIHEYMVPSARKGYALVSQVEHYGYVFDREEDRLAHYERNHSLLQKMIELEPDNLRWRTHLAQEYISVRDYKNIRRVGREGLEMLGERTDPEAVESLGTFYLCVIVSYEGEHRNEKEYRACQDALSDSRCTPLCAAFVRWWKAQVCYRMGLYGEAEKEILAYLRAYPGFLEDYFEYVKQRMALLTGQCYDPEKLRDAYGLLIAVGLRQQNVSYLEQYLDELHLEQEGINVNEGLLEAVLEAIASMSGQKALFDIVRKLRANGELWERFCMEIAEWAAYGNSGIQKVLDFCEKAGYEREIVMLLDWKEQEKELLRAVPSESWQRYKERFVRLSESIIGFYESAYGEDFRERSELPGACLMAMIMEEGFQYEDDKERFIETFKQCAGIYPYLAEPLKRLLTMYLEEPERKERAAKAELKRLRVQMVGQARELADAGSFSEALMILQQLKNIVPDDLEITALSLRTRIRALNRNKEIRS